MQFEASIIPGVALIRFEQHVDVRGSFSRLFCTNELAAAGFPFTVAQVNLSKNIRRHTLRGLHFQRPPHSEPKIVICSSGRIWDVAVDMREDSPTYRAWQAFELSPESNSALHLPAGIAHGFLTLEDQSEIYYLMGAPFVQQAAAGVRWDDRVIAVKWPAQPEVISEADKSIPLLGSQ